MPLLLSAVDLTKHYSDVAAVDRVGITLQRGRIRALIGENGAGKSTLMKMLTGVIHPDDGSIAVDGEEVFLSVPGDAARHGIAMVHQEVQSAPNLSALDNLMLVRTRIAKGYRRGSAAERAFAHAMFERVGLDVKPSALASTLSAAQLQLLEIAKALALDARIILFDEPTSALPPVEAARLLALIEALRTDHAILYVSHHLAEIQRLADDLTVLRDGRIVAELARGEADNAELVRLMVDRPIERTAMDLPPHNARPVLSIHKLATNKVRGLSFDLHGGEILGFAGLIGSGMHEAALALCGANRITAGEMRLHNKLCRFRNPFEAAQAGIALVPEERKAQAIVPDLSVHYNLHLGRTRLYKKGPTLNLKTMRHASEKLISRFGVRLRSLSQPIKTLSGGNQQKVILARCVQSQPKLLILSEPTRGVDVAAKQEIYRIILDLARSGMAMVIVSSELEEVLLLSHRVAVFSAGRMADILDRDDANPVAVMSLATPTNQLTESHLHAS